MYDGLSRRSRRKKAQHFNKGYELLNYEHKWFLYIGEF